MYFLRLTVHGQELDTESAPFIIRLRVFPDMLGAVVWVPHELWTGNAANDLGIKKTNNIRIEER